jgi:rhodanese-related sulfurtransferase
VLGSDPPGGVVLSLSPEIVALRIAEEAGRSLLLDVRVGLAEADPRPLGAIDLPAFAAPYWSAPEGARVYLLGAGPESDDVSAAANALIRMPGVEVAMVAGGFPAWLAAGLAVSAAEQGECAEPTAIDMTSLATVLETGRPVRFVDARSNALYLASRLPGATHAASLPRDHRPDSASTLWVVYGPSDEAASALVGRLKARGWQSIRYLSGGVEAWMGSGRRLTTARPASD